MPRIPSNRVSTSGTSKKPQRPAEMPTHSLGRPRKPDSQGSQSSRSSRRSTPEEDPRQPLMRVLNNALLPAKALVAADDTLVGLFNNPVLGLRVRTMSRTKPRFSLDQRREFNARFDSAFRRSMDSPEPAAQALMAQPHYKGVIVNETKHKQAFSNLAIRYALLKYSNRVYVSDITLRNMVQLCIRAKTFIPKNTSIEELGGIMSINAVDVFNQHGRKQEDWEPEYETFSIIRASSGQRGVGMRKDRLLMGPLRFVNHSCAPNAEFVVLTATSATSLKTIKDIQPGEEITVQYSEGYFAEGECACAVCEPPVSESPSRCTPDTTIQSSPGSSPSIDSYPPRRSKRLAANDSLDSRPRKRSKA